MDTPIDENTKKTVQKIPLLVTRAGPRDGENWTKRLKEEYLALIQVTIKILKRGI
jgi:ufm1-conjugating enzyme 1